MINQLVINGCSYNEVYASNVGPQELAKSLGISQAYSLSMGGSTNSRILRTTLKHSYRYVGPTLYLVGLTFISRWELPLVEATEEREFEGRWINPQSQKKAHERLQFNWTEQDTNTFKDLSFKAVAQGYADCLEDLMYKCLSMINDLKSRGNRVLVWNNCDFYTAELIDKDPRFQLIKDTPEFVDALRWIAIPWQHAQGARPVEYASNTMLPPKELHHVLPEDYRFLNDYLINYIQDHKILQ